MDENFVSAVVEIPEVHVPELEVTVVHPIRESDKHGKGSLAINYSLWDLDKTDKSVSDRSTLAISNLFRVIIFVTGKFC